MGPRRLLLKAGLFCGSLVPLYFGLHFLIYESHHYYRTRNDPDAVYIMGDSRTFYGVDITELKKQTGRTIYSYAAHGISGYALLKFAEMVPPKTQVILGVSWQPFRDKKDSSYRSGYSWRGLKLLWQGTGEYWHFRRIFVVNRVPLEAPLMRETPWTEQETDFFNLEKLENFYRAGEQPWFPTKKKTGRGRGGHPPSEGVHRSRGRIPNP